VFDLCEWIVSGPWTEKAPCEGGADTLKAAARRLLDHRWKALGRRAEALDWSDAAGRHKLRIQAKKLRYLCEAFLPRKQARSALERLERVQDALGRLNDMAVAPAAARLALRGVEAEAAFAAGLLVCRGRKGSRGLVKEARRAVKALRKPGRPWRRTGRP
jgi:CHAD domain-containing protein